MSFDDRSRRDVDATGSPQFSTVHVGDRNDRERACRASRADLLRIAAMIQRKASESNGAAETTVAQPAIEGPSTRIVSSTTPANEAQPLPASIRHDLEHRSV
jgi:hypothetical protein